MKKFVKYGTITGGILLIVGIGLATAAFVLGANPVRIVRFIEERFDYGNYDDWAAYSDSGSGEWSEPLFETELTEYEDPTGNGFEAGYVAVTEFNLSQSGGMVEILPGGAEDEFRVISEGGKIENMHYTGTEHWQRLSLDAREGESYTVYIPESWIMEKLEAEVTGGSFHAEGLQAMKAELHAMGGEISVEQLYGNEVELNCENGILTWSSLTSGLNQVDAECVSGQMDILIPQDLEDGGIRYDLEWDQGTISLPSEIFEGTGERLIDGDEGMTVFTLDAGPNGRITVDPSLV